MPEYRRMFRPGGTFFFTVVTHQRRPLFAQAAARGLLGQALRKVHMEQRFQVVAIVLMPEHLHCVWTLPDGDADFSTRWARIKWEFSHSWREAGGTEAAISMSRHRRRERGIWQRRFWEHTVRDVADLVRHNPVRHSNCHSGVAARRRDAKADG